MNHFLEVFQFAVVAVEELNTQVLLDDLHTALNGRVILYFFEEFEVEGNNLALNYFFVTLLGRKEHKRGWCEFIHQKINNRKIRQVEIFSLPLSNSSKYLGKESHHLLHLNYLHSGKKKKKRKFGLQLVHKFPWKCTLSFIALWYSQ